jgi:hypothetical protein
MGVAQAKRDEIVEAVMYLRKRIKPGDTVYTVIRKVSSSGMSRKMSLFIVKQGEIWDVTHYVAKATGATIDKKTGYLVVGGCGMDMAFHVVYSLGRALFPKGFIPAKAGRHGRNGSDPNAIDTDGGYALNKHSL